MNEHMTSCEHCEEEIKKEYHCEIYDTPPFYCSETCYGKRKMPKLKTLKDIQDTNDPTDYPPAVLVSDVKKEAIKWVKKMADMPFIQFPSPIIKLPDGSGAFTSDMINKEGIEDIIYWIKHFFNITSEDLK